MKRLDLSAGVRWLLRLAGALALVALLVDPAVAAGGDKGTGAPPKRSAKAYDYYLTGNAADMLPPAPGSQMLVLMGGGEDVDGAFAAMVAKARGPASGKVDVVVVRTSGADGYNPYLFAMDGVDSVETLVIKTREGANDPEVNDIVARADVLFIAGGDQSTYIALWQGTALDATLKQLLARRVPFGGTSAGLAVLGDVDYSGAEGSVTSATALANPYDKRVTLDTSFITGLPGLQGAITDAHLITRDRMGRLVTFLARMIGDGLSPLGVARGVGVNEATAVMVDDGTATVLGASAAYFVKPLAAAVTLERRKPLEIRSVEVVRLTAGGGRFDLAQWIGQGTTLYHLDAQGGALSSSQNGGQIY